MANSKFITTRVTVGATATLLAEASLNKSRFLLLQAPSTNTEIVYIGGANVSTSNGLQLAADKTLALETTGRVYGLRVTSDQPIIVANDRSN